MYWYEREQGGVFGQCEREIKEGRSVVIIL